MKRTADDVYFLRGGSNSDEPWKPAETSGNQVARFLWPVFKRARGKNRRQSGINETLVDVERVFLPSQKLKTLEESLVNPLFSDYAWVATLLEYSRAFPWAPREALRPRRNRIPIADKYRNPWNYENAIRRQRLGPYVTAIFPSADRDNPCRIRGETAGGPSPSPGEKRRTARRDDAFRRRKIGSQEARCKMFYDRY